jgi:hypothetical protein
LLFDSTHRGAWTKRQKAYTSWIVNFDYGMVADQAGNKQRAAVEGYFLAKGTNAGITMTV